MSFTYYHQALWDLFNIGFTSKILAVKEFRLQLYDHEVMVILFAPVLTMSFFFLDFDDILNNHVSNYFSVWYKIFTKITWTIDYLLDIEITSLFRLTVDLIISYARTDIDLHVINIFQNTTITPVRNPWHLDREILSKGSPLLQGIWQSAECFSCSYFWRSYYPNHWHYDIFNHHCNWM